MCFKYFNGIICHTVFLVVINIQYYIVCNITLLLCMQYSDSIYNKNSYHQSPYKVVTILLIISPYVHITCLCLIYFVARSLYLLIPLTYFILPPTPFPSGNQHLFSVSTSLFVFGLFILYTLINSISEQTCDVHIFITPFFTYRIKRSTGKN